MSKDKEATTTTVAEFLPGTSVMVDMTSPIGSPVEEHARPGVVMEHFKYQSKEQAGELSGQCSVKFDGSGKTMTVSTSRFLP